MVQNRTVIQNHHTTIIKTTDTLHHNTGSIFARVPEEGIRSENQLEWQKISNCLLLKHTYIIGISKNKPLKKNKTICSLLSDCGQSAYSLPLSDLNNRKCVHYSRHSLNAWVVASSWLISVTQCPIQWGTCILAVGQDYSPAWRTTFKSYPPTKKSVCPHVSLRYQKGWKLKKCNLMLKLRLIIKKMGVTDCTLGASLDKIL